MALNPIYFQIAIFLASFFVLWYSAGLIISVIVKLSKSWNLPRFTISFLVLGMMTSLPELVIGTTAVSRGEPEIFVGNLLGGVIVLFFLIIPLLALAGRGVALPKALTLNELVLSLVVILVPTYLSADQRLTRWEAVLCLVLYTALIYILAEHQSVFERINASVHRPNKKKFLDYFFKISLGVVLLFIASQVVVRSTENFATLLGISPFVMSLILVSIGTNIPELSLVMRSLFEKKQDIALADYIGSAAANTFMFGVLILLNGARVALPDHFLHRLVFLSLGLLYFFFLLRSGKKLSRLEAMTLLFGYGLFLSLELSVIQ